MKKSRGWPPPCSICGMPSELMGTKAEYKEHDRLYREARKLDPARKRAAKAWLAGRTSRSSEGSN